MEDKQVHIRQEPPLQNAVPVVEQSAAPPAAGIMVGGKVRVGTDIDLTQLRQNYGDKFTFDNSNPNSIVANEDMRVSGSFTIIWPKDVSSYPINHGRIDILIDGSNPLTSESFIAAEGPGPDPWENPDYIPDNPTYWGNNVWWTSGGGDLGPYHRSCGGFGPRSVGAGQRIGATVYGLTVDPEYVIVGVIWEFEGIEVVTCS